MYRVSMFLEDDGRGEVGRAWLERLLIEELTSILRGWSKS